MPTLSCMRLGGVWPASQVPSSHPVSPKEADIGAKQGRLLSCCERDECRNEDRCGWGDRSPGRHLQDQEMGSGEPGLKYKPMERTDRQTDSKRA